MLDQLKEESLKTAHFIAIEVVSCACMCSAQYALPVLSETCICSMT